MFLHIFETDADDRQLKQCILTSGEKEKIDILFFRSLANTLGLEKFPF